MENIKLRVKFISSLMFLLNRQTVVTGRKLQVGISAKRDFDRLI
jgi:hypothetical protein